MSVKSMTIKYDNICQITSKCGISLPKSDINSNRSIITFNALWDTGANYSLITKKVVDKLGLQPIGLIDSLHVGGNYIASCYLVDIFLQNSINFRYLEVVDGLLQSDIDIIIGMDVISHGDFAISNYNGQTHFSFRTPSTHHIDF